LTCCCFKNLIPGKASKHIRVLFLHYRSAATGVQASNTFVRSGVKTQICFVPKLRLAAAGCAFAIAQTLPGDRHLFINIFFTTTNILIFNYQ